MNTKQCDPTLWPEDKPMSKPNAMDERVVFTVKSLEPALGIIQTFLSTLVLLRTPGLAIEHDGDHA